MLQIRLISYLTILMSCVCFTCNGQNRITIIDQAKSQYSIVIPANPVKSETKAAEILQKYLFKAAKVTLPITSEKFNKSLYCIYLGRCNKSVRLDTILNDGYVLYESDRNIFIRGENGQGTLYGVYAFLELIGLRKYDAGEPFIPALNKVDIAKDYFQLDNPPFIYRQSYYPQSNNVEYLNWHKLQKFEDLWGVWGHSFFKIIPPKIYYSTHPEYFSLIKGKREATQLCLSNATVYKLTVDYFKKAIINNPDAIYWSISPDDNLGYCTCDLCKKIDMEEGGPQGSLIRFVNKVAAVFPTKKFTTLAYTYTSKPPKITKPAQNVYPLLSTIDAYRTLPISLEPTAAAFRKNLKDWSQVTPTIFVWDYTTQFTNYIAPFPDYNNLSKNSVFFKENGVKGIFSQGSGDTYGDLAELNSYLQAKLLWNPDLDFDEVKQEFLTGYYGKAGLFIDLYITELQKQLIIKKVKLDIYGNPINNYTDFLSPELINTYSDILDKAEAAVETDATKLERVYRARLPMEYAALQQSRFFGADKYGYLIAKENNLIVNPRWPLRVKRFVDLCNKAHVVELSEGGITPNDYLKEWEVIFKKELKDNKALNAKVTLVNPYSADYPAKKERTLVDGVKGYNDFSYSWLLFYGKDMIATIDMGVSKKITQIEASFLKDARHYIFNPINIAIEVSKDGITYTKIAAKPLKEVNKEEDYLVNSFSYYFTLPLNTDARYIKLIAICPVQLPDWRISATKKPTIACDEICVN